MAIKSGADHATRQGEEEALQVDGLEARALSYQVQTPNGLFLHEFVRAGRGKNSFVLTFFGLQSQASTDHPIFRQWLNENVFLTSDSIKKRKAQAEAEQLSENHSPSDWNQLKSLNQMSKEEISQILRNRKLTLQNGSGTTSQKNPHLKNRSRILLVGPDDGGLSNLQKPLEKDGVDAHVIATD